MRPATQVGRTGAALLGGVTARSESGARHGPTGDQVLGANLTSGLDAFLGVKFCMAHHLEEEACGRRKKSVDLKGLDMFLMAQSNIWSVQTWSSYRQLVIYLSGLWKG